MPLRHQRFGRLQALFPEGPRHWVCTCDCGAIHTTLKSSLVSGKTKSCGCYRREFVTASNTTHGQSKSPTYVSWNAMWTRCTNSARKVWHYYGGRGIQVCEEWKSFEQFVLDLGERPDGLSLERKDSNKGYFKDNCYWATSQQQSWSRRNTRWIEFGGQRKPLSVWATELGYSWIGLHARLARLPLNEALTPKLK